MSDNHFADRSALQLCEHVNWDLRAHIDEESQLLQLHFDYITDQEEGEWTCKTGPYTTTDALNVGLQSDFTDAQISLAPESRNQPLKLRRVSDDGLSQEWLELSLQE